MNSSPAAGASANPSFNMNSSAMMLNSAPVGRPHVDLNEQPGLNRDRHPGIAVIDINEIKANEFQPRRDFDETALNELAQSIR